ncbi:MAG: alpha/beta hydrolase fold domain-containing protein [Bacteroidales bacterium]|nr:alpha/beta hydrolase fold domain-containing protein [Bacteroidales bacterium]
MKRLLSFFIVFIAFSIACAAQNPDPATEIDSLRCKPDESIAFAQYDTLVLEMDLYFPSDDAGTHPCILFTYGGGFILDNQRVFSTRRLCRMLADEGYVVAATNYRLGLKGVKFKGPASMVKPLERAVLMAAEDVMKATRYVLDYAAELSVDPRQIILVGSSAGAIASLQCDFERCNRSELAQRYLPEDFRFAGVASFSGAIFSRKGLEYKHDVPAPTLFLHGTADKLVPYKQIKVFNIGFYGSDKIVRQFKKRHYPHRIIRFQDEGHGVAVRYFANFDDLRWFLDKMVKDARPFEIDESCFDPLRPSFVMDKYDPSNLY